MKPGAIIAIILGIVFLVIGVMYFTQDAGSLPSFFPGYAAKSHAHHNKHAIAAVVVGGTSLFGGKGSVVGTFVGTLIIGVLANILNLTGVDPFVQQLFKGALIVVAVFIMSRSGRT